jgi:hypothetical protein
MRTWVKNMLKKNEEETRIDKVEAKLAEQEPLESRFPEDLFGLFNKQMVALGLKLKGEMYVSALSLWLNFLQEILKDKVDVLVQNVQLDKLLKYPLEINDYYKLAQNLNDNKNELAEYIDDALLGRTTQMFVQTARVISASTDKLIENMIEVMFTKIEETAVEQLFT